LAKKRPTPRGPGIQGLAGNAAATADEEAQSRQDEHEVVAVEVEPQANRKEREKQQAQHGRLFPERNARAAINSNQT